MSFNLDFNESGGFPLLPEGTYQVAFAALQDIGMHEGFYDKQANRGPQEKFVMWFYTDEEESTEGEQHRFKLRSKPLPKSTAPSSNLVKYFLAIMGGKQDEELTGGGNVGAEELADALVGNNVMVTVKHSQDGKWANIVSISAVPAKQRGQVSADGFEIPGEQNAASA